MSIIIIILFILAGIIALLLIIAIFMRKTHSVAREVVIDAPRQKVFDYVRMLKNQDEFNLHAMADVERKKEFTGTDGTVGYKYAWSGDKNAGVGEKEIIAIVEGQKIEMEIRFVKPMKATAIITMETESLPAPHEDRTKVSWSNAGVLKYPFNLLIPVMERHVARDMMTSLTTLKTILEK